MFTTKKRLIMSQQRIGLTRMFETAAGTTTGSMHRRLDKNNQDAFGLIERPDMIIGIVCDGASKGLMGPMGDWTHSEVGAQLSTRWLLSIVQKYCTLFLQRPHELSEDLPFPYWEDIRQELIHLVKLSAEHMDGNSVERTVDYFLCTVFGVMVTPFGACLFSIGDGIFILNGNIQTIGPFPGNKPPYFAYALTGSDVTDARSDLLSFNVRYVPVLQLESLVVGTDGVGDLLEQSDNLIPGTQELVGPIDKIWTDDAHFTNPISLSRYLSRVNRNSVQLDREAVKLVQHNGLLPDDTTCVVVRRRMPI
jgi:hypothetical protein